VTEQLVAVAQQALLLALALAMPVVIAAVVGGVVSGLLGAMTQVQDAAIGVALRLAAAAATLVFFGPTLAARLLAFGREIMALVERAAQAGGG
jgi:type III secretion protein S